MRIKWFLDYELASKLRELCGEKVAILRTAAAMADFEEVGDMSPRRAGLHLGYTSVTCCFYWQQYPLDTQQVGAWFNSSIAHHSTEKGPQAWRLGTLSYFSVAF
jgi:hypothetical protein